MRRALAFCNSIKTSKRIQGEFTAVVADYLAGGDIFEDAPGDAADDDVALNCEIEHVDGTFNAKSRTRLLEWLKEDTGEDTCRILTNVRCLSEGVDVPALDAIMFLHPRKSQIDVVQSVGRVMRKAEGKTMGYVILPVGVPAGMAPERALDNNETYRVVWQILNALRAHDDRFDATINQAGLGEDVSDRIEIVGVNREEQTATTAVVETLPGKPAPEGSDIGKSVSDGSDPSADHRPPEQTAFVLDEFSKAIMAKIVKKCGTRGYWEDWAADIAKIAQNHITRITAIVARAGSDERKAFLAFLEEIRDDLNPEISETDAVEMLAQHLITKPVFDTLFKDNAFTQNNPVSRAMEAVLAQLDQHNLGKEADSLQGFYADVQRRAADIKTAQSRQALVVELYDKFFRTAFPTLTQKLGIVYTPIEVVDFIIHSVNDVLQSEFGQTLGSPGVHILDPFTGTGTFITRLLQAGLIKPEELEHKYRHEIHANEIVLLAYYIAAINIEAVYHDMAPKDAPYTPFEGICLTDTFQMYEQDQDMAAKLLPDNSERRTRQKALDIRVIMGNPPYSVGQRSANDNAANIEYPNLDMAIRDSYAAQSTATLKNALYDSYIRAIRWATDRIKDKGSDAGVVAFVSNAGWIDGNATDGLRKCLVEEFSSLYVFHLRGDIRKNMLSKGAAKEGQNIFGSGSMTGISIAVLVRNPAAQEFGKIHFHDIGDDLTTDNKKAALRSLKSINGITKAKGWQRITPDHNHDWLDQVDRAFEKFIVLGDKKDKGAETVFENYSKGVTTSRDAWCYNFSQSALRSNMRNTIEFYNLEVARYAATPPEDRPNAIAEFINSDPTKISWTSALKWDLEKAKQIEPNDMATTVSAYRPFQKQWVYSDRMFVHQVAKMSRIFPDAQAENRVICVSGVGARAGFSALMADALPDYHNIDNCQCFPLKLYKPPLNADAADDDLYAGEAADGPRIRDGISDEGLAHFQAAWPGEVISKEDLFYYIYGLLHAPDYRARFKNNLAKELPRIPAVKQGVDFWAFSKAGRALGDLHVNYENVEPYPVVIKQRDLRLADIPDPQAFYRVTKMKYARHGREKDKTTVIYNPHITLTEIPLRAYDYVVNGKPALDWVMDRQCVKTDKDSGIVNDANAYANETIGNPAYPLELFQRVITVSLETLDIVDGLPKLEMG